MKLIFENWKAYITEQLLIESRLKDAVALATNFKKRLPRDMLDAIPEGHADKLKEQLVLSLKYMSSRDPSGRNKYLLWSAKYLVNQLAKYMEKRVVSRPSSTSDLSMTTTPRYAAGEDPEELLERYMNVIQSRAERLADRLIIFEKGVEMGLIHVKPDPEDPEEEMRKMSGIDKWDPTNPDHLENFELMINGVQQKIKQAEMMKKYEEQAKSESAVLATDSEDYTIVRPLSAEASCYFGQGTRWCISATESQNYFDNYSGQGKAFYFVNFAHLGSYSDEDFVGASVLKKLALVYSSDNPDEPEEVFDAGDDEIGTGGLRDAVTYNLIAKALKNMPGAKKFKRKHGKLPDLKGFYDAIHDTRAIDREGRVAAGILRPGEFAGPEGVPEDNTYKELKVIHHGLGLEGSSGDVDAGEMREQINDAISWEESEIVSAAGYHFGENPAGIPIEKYEEKLEGYELQYINVQLDDYGYDDARVHWNAGARINTEDLEFIEEDDIDDKVRDVIDTVLDSNHIYPDEIEVQDAEAGEIYISFNPDYDEQEGLEQFETFLDRMSGYDDNWETMMDEVAIKAMEDGLTQGNIPDVKKALEDVELSNFDFEIEGRDLLIDTTIQAKVVKPKVVADNPEMIKHMLEALTFKTSDAFNKMEDAFFTVVESMMKTALNYYYSQEVLDFGDEDEGEEIFPDLNMGLHPVFAELHREKGMYSGPRQAADYGGGSLEKYDPLSPKEKVLQLPYRFIITLSGDEAWENIDLSDPKAVHPVVKFLQFLDQEDMQFKLEEALTNSVLKGIEHWLDQAARKIAASGVELDHGDDADQDEQDLPPGTAIDAPFNPPQIAESRRRLPEAKKRKMRKFKIKITESKRKRKLNEIKPSLDLWQANAILVTNTPTSQDEPGLEDFKNSIRVRCGVTIVDNIGASKSQGGRTTSKLRIKFVSDGPPEQMLDSLKKLIVQIEGVRTVSFISGTLVKAEEKWQE